jgi:HK97 family phage prohead protease
MTLLKNDFYFSLDIVKSGHEGKGFYIEGYAATKDLDRQGDIIVLDALKEAAIGLLEFGNTVFFNHDYNRAIGRLDDAKVDNQGLWVKIYISQWEEELRKKIEEGIISKFSIGGRLTAGERVSPTEAIHRFPYLKTKPATPVNVISSMELFEVSVVGLPANCRAEFAHKSLTKALQDVVGVEDIFKIENLGAIPDEVKDDKLPKPVTTKKDVEVTETKELIAEEVVVEKTAVEEVKTEEIVTAPLVEEVKSEEVKAEEVKIDPAVEPVVKQEVAADPAPASVVVETVKETTEVITTSESQEGKHVITQESKVDTTKETLINDALKVTETAQVIAVRTYTEEELKAIRADYQKQLDEKEAMIKSLTAEVDGLKIEKANQAPITEQLNQITKDLGALQAKVKEVVVDPSKSTPLVNKDAVVPVKEVKEVVTPEQGFLKVLQGK